MGLIISTFKVATGSGFVLFAIKKWPGVLEDITKKRGVLQSKGGNNVWFGLVAF